MTSDHITQRVSLPCTVPPGGAAVGLVAGRLIDAVVTDACELPRDHFGAKKKDKAEAPGAPGGDYGGY